MRPHWFFVDQNNGATKPWRWRRLLLAGEAVTTSEFYENFGEVIYSAMRAGFSPREEPWVVISGNGETLFEATPNPHVFAEAGIHASTSRDELSADGSPDTNPDGCPLRSNGAVFD